MRQAVELFRAGEVVALPTETVYGLAANALDAKAVSKIFKIKGRPANNPIIVHVASVEMAKRCVSQVAGHRGQIGQIILARPADACAAARKRNSRHRHGGRRDSRRSLAESSVHSGCHSRVRFSARRAEREFVGLCFADERRTRSQTTRRENSLDCGRRPIAGRHRIHRARFDRFAAANFAPGHDSRRIAGGRGCGKSKVQTSKVTEARFALRSPGLLEKHYAPKAKLVVLNWHERCGFELSTFNFNFQPSTCHVIAHTQIPAGGEFCAGECNSA